VIRQPTPVVSHAEGSGSAGEASPCRRYAPPDGPWTGGREKFDPPCFPWQRARVSSNGAERGTEVLQPTNILHRHMPRGRGCKVGVPAGKDPNAAVAREDMRREEGVDLVTEQHVLWSISPPTGPRGRCVG